VRWTVLGCRSRDIRVFAMHSLGLQKEELDSVEPQYLRKFKSSFRRAAGLLNKKTLLYKSENSFKRFKAVCRKAFREGIHLLDEYVLACIPKPPIKEAPVVRRHAVRNGMYAYFQPFTGFSYRWRGHRSFIQTGEQRSLLEGDHIAYLLTMIEQTRVGFFDEDTLSVLFGLENIEVNDWSSVPYNAYTFQWKDDAWYEGTSPAGHRVTLKVPKMVIDPQVLRRNLEAVLDSPPGIEIDLSDIWCLARRPHFIEIKTSDT
jgi:hypothetical protein